jgi:hypothetical protein
MSAIANPPRHQVARAIVDAHLLLDEVSDASVWSMDPEEATKALCEATRLAARVAELEARVAGHAKTVEVGQDVGATSTKDWWAHTTRQTRAEAGRKMRLAEALTVHEPTRAALAAGEVVAEQALVIAEAVDQLPDDIPDSDQALVDRAERHLLELAGAYDAKALKRIGRHLLEVIAPELADAHQARLLEREEERAAQATRLTMTDDGHGTTQLRATLPTLTAHMLRKALLAYAAPKHRAAVDGHLGERRPHPQRMGQAFCEYVQRFPTNKLPKAGGLAAAVVVTMDLETLMGGLKAAHLDTGQPISPGLARRMACEAGIIPAVLGGDSMPLDLGREDRFFGNYQRVALYLRDQECTTVGCDWPPGLCHAHHDKRWTDGGRTDLDDGRLLCPRHHARIHDPQYKTTRHPDGQVSFHRRT